MLTSTLKNLGIGNLSQTSHSEASFMKALQNNLGF